MRNIFHKQSRTGKASSGFTLIEVMVSVGIFSIVMLVALGAVLAIVGANRKAQAVSSIINNLNFALEGMMRDLRTGTNYSGSGSSMSFDSTQSGANVTYALSDGHITRNGEEITADEVKVDSMEFYVVGESKTDVRQAKVLIVIKGQAGVNKDLTNFNIQTMVSQRKLDLDCYQNNSGILTLCP